MNFIILSQEDYKRDMTIQEIREGCREDLLGDGESRREVEYLKATALSIYRSLTEQEIESLINLCTNQRIANILWTLIPALDEVFTKEGYTKEDARPYPEIAEETLGEVRNSFEREWQDFLR